MNQSASESGVSIVICTHNGAGLIANTLDCLMAQRVSSGIEWEVVLVDNASTDGTADVARSHWSHPVPLRIIPEERLGVGFARLTGIRESQYEYVCFVDDDNHLNEDWVDTAFRLMQAHPRAGAIGGYNDCQCETTPPAWFQPYAACYAVGGQAPEEGELTEERRALWSAGMILRKTAWSDLEQAGFNPLLSGRSGKKKLSGEDTEICYLLRILGWKVYYFTSLKLTHQIPSGRLRWTYLCRLQRGFGAASIYLKIYRQILHYRQTGEEIREKHWARELLNDTGAMLGSPLVLGATLFRLYEGNDRVVRMHAVIGRWQERLRLGRRLEQIEDKLWSAYAYLD